MLYVYLLVGQYPFHACLFSSSYSSFLSAPFHACQFVIIIILSSSHTIAKFSWDEVVIAIHSHCYSLMLVMLNVGEAKPVNLGLIWISKRKKGRKKKQKQDPKNSTENANINLYEGNQWKHCPEGKYIVENIHRNIEKNVWNIFSWPNKEKRTYYTRGSTLDKKTNLHLQLYTSNYRTIKFITLIFWDANDAYWNRTFDAIHWEYGIRWK